MADTVIVIDDDIGMREALCSLIESVGLKVHAYGSVRDFLAAAPINVVSCLVLDVRLPGQSGLDLQEHLSKAGVQLPIIFVTGHADIPMSVRAMKAGAVEFLTKPFRDQELLDAIQSALESDRARRDAGKIVAAIEQRFDGLTARERDVLRLVISGRLNKQIAGELGISEITVKAHRGQVMRKMEARSLADLVRMAGKIGLCPAEG